MKKHRYTYTLLLAHVIIIPLAIYGEQIHREASFGSIPRTICMIAPWYLLLPLDTFWIARKIYPSRKQWSNRTSGICIYLLFISILDPGGYDPVFGLYRGRYSYQWFRDIQSNFTIIPRIIEAVLIGGGDLLLRYAADKLGKKNHHL